ncbi:MAG: multiheme c-type cytochrome [Myxococcaceae bacterium]
MRTSSTWFLLCSLAVATPVAAADFMGAESCKACHPEAYAAWRTSKHARAYETLSPQQKKDARCVSCHAPDLRVQGVAGVTCETCHGGGQYYSPEYVMKDPELARLVGLIDPSEKQCRSCHDASSPSIHAFEFGDKLKLIDHWSAERARRAAPPPPPKKAPAPKKRSDAKHPDVGQAVADAAAMTVGSR